MEARPPAQQSDPTTANRLALSEALALIGLEEYEERLIQNGFEDWETLAAITEADMEELGFKLGDRRKLQHSIRDQGHLLFDSSVEYWNIISPSRPSLRRLSNLNQPSGTATSSSSQAQHPPRQYRRHPRPDPNAPPRPKTAYVLFSEQIRNDPEWKVASFTEVAKEAGRRWRDLPPEIRSDVWEEPATERFQAYREDLGRYKQTEEYRDYQEYQEKFEQDQRQSSRAKGRSNDKATSVLSGPAEPEEQEGARRMSILQIAASEGQDEDTPLPVRPGLDEVRHIRAQLGISPDMVGTEFPDEQETYKAVEAFLAGTGSLLYLWDQDAARSLVRSVYESRNEPPLAYTEVFAMAAVGSYCDGEGHSPSVHEKFLHLFISTLSTSSGMISDLRSMRVFACLAICRFTDNVESSRALICAFY